MFTGIIQRRAEVVEVAPRASGAGLVLDARGWDHAPAPGDSIAVSGCCLTVVEAADGRMRFDVIHQTLRSTTLGNLSPGDRVNLEHAATPATLLGGHIVQGHVDGVGVVKSITTDGREHRLRIEPPRATLEYVVHRGSIAVDGVSLTIAALDESTFEVALIPTTLDLTTLRLLREGDHVNLEVDYLARVVIEWMKRREFRGRRFGAVSGEHDAA